METPRTVSEALERGRIERSKAFYSGFAAFGSAVKNLFTGHGFHADMQTTH